MNTFEFVCLANSNKYGGRCIAGVKTDGSGWFRPVSDEPTGTLYEGHYLINPYREPELFDILQVECTEAIPQCHQPENWLLSDQRWRLVGRATIKQLNDLLTSELKRTNHAAFIFGNDCDRISVDTLQQNPAASSLCLVHPQVSQWHIHSRSGRKKYRVTFTVNHSEYNLGITDPEWQELLKNIADGDYSSEELKDTLNLETFGDKFLLTLSLGEPFQPSAEDDEYCFKLVAAVMNTDHVKSLLKAE